MNLHYGLWLFAFLFIASCAHSNSDNGTASEQGWNPEVRLQFLAQEAISDLDEIPYDSLRIPRSIDSSGQLEGTPSKSWTSGFYPGMLWQLYQFSQNDTLKNAALTWQSPVEKEKLDSTTHDLGFKVYCSFGNAFQITKEEAFKDIVLTAAQTLSKRFNERIGAMRSWDHHDHIWGFPVIIDNMMNLELLFEATAITGDSSYYQIANQHALTTLDHHFRADYSSYHVVDYDPATGSVVKKNTHQGYSHESAWSRGQAWGLYGYTVAYRYTGNKKFLDQAIRIADFFFNHSNLPDDMIPYWDFDAPKIPDEPRDVSAAAVAASGLLELREYSSDNYDQYSRWADAILQSLEDDKYQSEEPPFFLDHSVGSVPGKFEIDVPIIYADYYYVEALLRRTNAQVGK